MNTGIKGKTAPKAAAGGGHEVVVERLLRAGAVINTTAAKYGKGTQH